MILTIEDYKLIESASKVIQEHYDSENFNHTVAAALLCGSGNIYVGINVYSLHGACAEQVAIGTAVANGEKQFKCIVAIRGKEGNEIIPPCGNCRQLLNDLMPECEVILSQNDQGLKVRAKELLPFAYSVQ